MDDDVKNLKLSIIPDFRDPGFHDQKDDAVSRTRKETIMVYISPELAEQLEEARFYGSKLISRERRKRLTKSQFYGLILEDVINNYKALGEKSNLFKLIRKWAD